VEVSSCKRMTDREFILAFESCTLPDEFFKHREHLRLAWLYLQASPYDDAVERMSRSIRKYAAHHGASGKYHHTLTMVWMRLVAAARATDANDDFDEFLTGNCALLDKRLPRRYYSAERLESEPARNGWVAPDLSPLPSIPASTCTDVAYG